MKKLCFLLVFLILLLCGCNLAKEETPNTTTPEVTTPAENQHEHVFKTEVFIEPTCDKPGLKREVCECGEMIETNFDVTGEHHYDDFTCTKEPTCAEAGERVDRCVTCGDRKIISIPPTGKHLWGETVLTQEPTCIKEGEQAATCTVCGVIQKESIPATGEHSYVDAICKWCGEKDATVPFLCGDALFSYVIVYDEHASDYTVRAAEYIAAEIEARTGILLPVMPIDASDTENAHEIVVGETVRPISQDLNAPTEGMEFALLANEDHVAIEGDYFIIAAAAYYFVQTCIPTSVFDVDVPQTVSICAPIVQKAKSFILLVGDGMGPNQTKLFEAYKNANIADYSDGEDFFYGYLFPHIGEAKTNSLSGVTDSAAAGTALASGYKTVNGYIGKDGNKNDVPSLTELAAGKGKATAVMSTEAQTGATPASFSAHANSRNDSADILASQAKLIEDCGTVIDCNYNFYTDAEIEALRAAILKNLASLSLDEDGFFLLYEEAYIDKHCHSNDTTKTYLAMLRFNQAIALFMEYAFYHPDTMVIITADHETGGLQIDNNGEFQYTSGSHTATNVPVFAYGADAAVFDGAIIENVQIPKTIAALFGVAIEGTNPWQYPALVPVS
ncbi:MAG: alkaline phosphatase [Clostridia bacterium]|nr:alkaline phosphatase [Clostridia bacterium]